MGCRLNLTLLFRHLESNEENQEKEALAGFNSQTAVADGELSIHLSLEYIFIVFACLFLYCVFV